MCTNAALVDSLECYMDELVESFEDFVKKSLLLITVAVGTVIAMLMYVLKVVTDRQQSIPTSPIAVETARSTPPCNVRRRSNSSLCSKSLQSVRNSSLQKDVMIKSFVPNCSTNTPKTCTTSANTTAPPRIPSFEEELLKEIGPSHCTQTCKPDNQTVIPKRSTSRLTIPSLPECLPKHHLSPSHPCSKIMANSTSCCSMCCEEDR